MFRHGTTIAGIPIIKGVKLYRLVSHDVSGASGQCPRKSTDALDAIWKKLLNVFLGRCPWLEHGFLFGAVKIWWEYGLLLLAAEFIDG